MCSQVVSSEVQSGFGESTGPCGQSLKSAPVIKVTVQPIHLMPLPWLLTGGLLESETGPRELSAEFIFHCPSLQHDGPSPALGLLHIPLLLWELR